MSKFIRLLLPVMCLFAVLGCKTLSNSADSGKSSSQDKTALTPLSTSKNKLIGTWVGKSADGSNELKMTFTEDEFTLYSNGKMVAGAQKYTFKDDETLEVKSNQGTTYPMKASVSGDALTVVMKETKINLRRQ